MWACDACTVINEDLAATACTLCETPRSAVAAAAPTGFVGNKRARPTPSPASVPEPDDDDDDSDDGAMEMMDDDDDCMGFAEVEPEPAAATKKLSLRDRDRDATSAAASMEDARMDAELAKSFTGGGSAIATRTLMNEYKNLLRSMRNNSLHGIEVSMPDDANGYHWQAEVTPPEGSALHKQLEAYAVTNRRKPVVELELLFDSNFPYSPPFVRVLRPRFAPRTGHITSGGSICIEALTRNGWTANLPIESLLVQIQALINDSQPPATLDPFGANRPYGMQEAREAFRRVAADHGWRA